MFINPKIGSHRIIDITRADVVNLHQSMKATPYQANRTLGVLSVVFTVAHTWEVRTDGNPCWKVKRYKKLKRERYLTAEELARLGKVLRESNTEREAVDCIRLLLLTDCRLGEIQKLKWEYVDFVHGLLRLPDSKTGAKLVPIGEAAINVLKSIPRLADNPYVITGTIVGQRLTDMQKPWRRLRGRAGLDDLRIHDHLRRDDIPAPGMFATTYGRYAIEAGGWIDNASLAIDRNSQSARIFGNAAANSMTGQSRPGRPCFLRHYCRSRPAPWAKASSVR